MADKYCAGNKRMHKKRYMAIILVALLLLAGAAGIVAARYISEYKKETEIHASNFHFSSDYLKYVATGETVPQYTVSDWGSHSVWLQLFNYEQENVSLVSDTQIQYTITVSADWSVTVSDTQGVIVPEGDVYTMGTGVTAHSVKLTYTGKEAQPGDLTVTVASKEPYEKKLEAKFHFSTKRGIEYTVADKDDYDVITITTNDYYGTVNVSWDATKHSPDNTNVLMGTWNDKNQTGSFTANEYTTYTLIFVENTAGVYGKDDFKIAGE